MTIQQLQYVLEIRKTGSISKAAKNLYLSQPNISNAIKNLERELGITILERTPAGVELTRAGRRLAERAEGIISSLREVAEEQRQDSSTLFRLLYPRYVPAFDAFIELCRTVQDAPRLQLACYIVSEAEQQVEMLYRKRCDMAVSLWERSSSLDKLCADLNVQKVALRRMPYFVQLAEGHPLLDGSPFDPRRLADYPYVAFSDGSAAGDRWAPWENIINSDKVIRVQSTTSRVKLVAATHAFSLVMPHTAAYNRANHVVQLPLHGKEATLGYLYSRERGLPPLGQDYIRLLKAQLDQLEG